MNEGKLDKIKSGINIPFNEREERPYFYLVISESPKAIEILEEYLKYLKEKIK